MNNQNKNRGIIYSVIGILTLVITIVGATFAYFTATTSINNVITGNMATVKLSLNIEKVVKVDEAKGGMIPMSNSMVEAAVNDSENDVCVDDNENAVCQIYKITITNDSSAGQFVDGYVSLRYGSGAPVDYTGTWKDGAKFNNSTREPSTTGTATTMRWAQVFVDTVDSEDYTTAGEQPLGTGTTEKVTFTEIGDINNAHNRSNIRTVYGLMTSPDDQGGTIVNDAAILKNLSISGTEYKVIGTNYIRISNHNWTADATGKQSYKRQDDVTSALVFNHSIEAGKIAEYYIVVWLSETGTNQTANVTANGVTNPDILQFFEGNVTFISAQGSEVSATFSSYSKVSSQG